MFPIILVTTAVTAIFFYSLATRGNFKSFVLASSIPPVVSCFLGGMLGLMQAEDKNPWRNTKIRIFKL